jgi:hypothetical protein
MAFSHEDKSQPQESSPAQAPNVRTGSAPSCEGNSEPSAVVVCAKKQE